MELHPFPLPDVPQPGPVDTGWARAIHRGPRTIDEVLRSAGEAMDAEDEAAELDRDPVAWLRARRPRTLFNRLFGRC